MTQHQQSHSSQRRSPVVAAVKAPPTEPAPALNSSASSPHVFVSAAGSVSGRRGTASLTEKALTWSARVVFFFGEICGDFHEMLDEVGGFVEVNRLEKWSFERIVEF